MKQRDRQAKVTPETTEEARRLRELWASKPHRTQAEFGEAYEVGNQSAVSQFLNGKVPLSLKAANGFAQELGVTIQEFSPRLAAEARSIANMVPASPMQDDVAEVAASIASLPERQRAWVLSTVREAIALAQQTILDGAISVSRKHQEDPSGQVKTVSRKRRSG